MRRGDVYAVSLSGPAGKPRPAVVVQADPFLIEGGTVLMCPLTSDLTDTSLFRPLIDPSAENGLRLPSQVMTDKLTAARPRELGQRIGKLSDQDLWRLEQALVTILGLRLAPTVVRLPGSNT